MKTQIVSFIKRLTLKILLDMFSFSIKTTAKDAERVVKEFEERNEENIFVYIKYFERLYFLKGRSRKETRI